MFDLSSGYKSYVQIESGMVRGCRVELNLRWSRGPPYLFISFSSCIELHACSVLRQHAGSNQTTETRVHYTVLMCVKAYILVYMHIQVVVVMCRLLGMYLLPSTYISSHTHTYIAVPVVNGRNMMASLVHILFVRVVTFTTYWNLFKLVVPFRSGNY